MTVVPLQKSGKFKDLIFIELNIDDPKERENALEVTQGIEIKPMTVGFTEVEEGGERKRFALTGMQQVPRIQALIDMAQASLKKDK